MASLINRRIEDTYQFLLQVEGDLLQNGSGSTGEINMSGSSFISGSFSGDGSNLTGIVSGSWSLLLLLLLSLLLLLLLSLVLVVIVLLLRVLIFYLRYMAIPIVTQ